MQLKNTEKLNCICKHLLCDFLLSIIITANEYKYNIIVLFFYNIKF